MTMYFIFNIAVSTNDTVLYLQLYITYTFPGIHRTVVFVQVVLECNPFPRHFYSSCHPRILQNIAP